MLVTLLIFTFTLTCAGIAVISVMLWAFSRDTKFAAWADQIGHLLFKPKSFYGRNRPFDVSRDLIKASELALIERSIENLKQVYIISNTIEKPNPTFLGSVIENFRNGVQYNFFVASASISRPMLDDYRVWFEQVYNATKSAAQSDDGGQIRETASLDDLFQIRVLPGHWLNPPYVFYSYEPQPGHTETLAFRGSKIGGSASPFYQTISPEDAETIIDAFSRLFPDFRVALSIEAKGVNEGASAIIVPLLKSA
jgi:hypothetical protein